MTSDETAISSGFADNPSGCDFATNGTTPSCSGPLPGSTFAGGDGNLMTTPTTFGTTDWQNVTGLNQGIDLPSGNTDNSFKGSKEDDPNVTVATSSVSSTVDITRFYEASESTGGHNLLYLAWERAGTSGTANLDFEINQLPTPGLGNPGNHTINRTTGDLLVTFDFNNGGGSPSLALLSWLPLGPCFSNSSAPPCWGNEQSLNGTNAIGAVNNLDAVTDPLQSPAASLPAETFGEAAIDLTAARAFAPGVCNVFRSAFAKSRNSTTFSATLADLVAPINVSFTNCGTINVHKATENGDSIFGYTTSGGLSPPTFDLSNGQTRSYGPNTVLAGAYSVTESSLPSGWTLRSLVCTASGDGTSVTSGGAIASITMAPQGVVDCTYTNHVRPSPTITTALSPPSAALWWGRL